MAYESVDSFLKRCLLTIPVVVMLFSASALTHAAESSAVEPVATTKADKPAVTTSSSFALRGEPKYKAGFAHFDYANPDAPQGGIMRRSAVGTFDNLHRYAQRGTPATASDELYDPLMKGSLDELDVYYPLIAEKISYPDDYSFLRFHINPKATFQDGKPITAESVKFSFEKFAAEGVPQFKKYYSFVKKIEVDDKQTVTFHLEGANREEMASLLSLKILPEHYWGSRNFGEPSKEIPVGSSGMTIDRFKLGQFIEYRFLDDYWAKDLPVNKGSDNFDIVRYDYYLDANVAFEGFKSGQFEFWEETQAKNWATAYDFPALTEGKVKRESLDHSLPQATSGFIFNTQRPLFKDRRVREALSYLLDFEWMNKALFYDQYTRTRSYFTNTEYASSGLPSEAELAILEPMKALVPPQVLNKAFELPETKGDGNIRTQMRRALALLKEAGWTLKDGRLLNKDGEPFEFEFIARDPQTERIVAPFKANLEKIGITLNVRRIDASQFINRLRNHDFDMLSGSYPALPTPSSDMKILFDSKFVDSTWNIANIQDEAIDKLVAGITANLTNDEALLAWGRAFDRVALWNYFLIPHWHISAFRIAYWDKFERPEDRPEYDLGESLWWSKDAK
tara:strand:- start:62741 stop:64606 length:1866 start_codon:yes stop_codon:yes gene_type:complete